MKHDNYAVYIIILVGIVGLVALTGVVLNNNGKAITGQAFASQKCYETDNGDDIYSQGITSGYNIFGNYVENQDYCYHGSDIVDYCDYCSLVEYYCSNGVVRQKTYTPLRCNCGEMASSYGVMTTCMGDIYGPEEISEWETYDDVFPDPLEDDGSLPPTTIAKKKI